MEKTTQKPPKEEKCAQEESCGQPDDLKAQVSTLTLAVDRLLGLFNDLSGLARTNNTVIAAMGYEFGWDLQKITERFIAAQKEGPQIIKPSNAQVAKMAKK